MKGWKSLQARLDLQPRVHLGVFPTPLQHLPRYGATLGHQQVYIKRDDLTGIGMGGNKTRSLEFLLGDAVATGADTIITGGGLQSNLCRLTAAAAAHLGLRCILVHNDDSPPDLEGNMLLSALAGAEFRFLGPVSEHERALAMDRLHDELRRGGPRPYTIHNGASTPRGALGYTAGAAELVRQTEETGLNLRHVVIVGAMGGTAAGLVAGVAMLGHPFHVHVISVEYPLTELHQRITELARGVFQLLDFRCPVDVESVMTLHEDYLGEGYAIPTPGSVDAMQTMAQTEGLFLELVYTSKTLAGLAGLVERGVIERDEPVCYWHTGGAPALFAQGRQLQALRSFRDPQGRCD